MKIYESNGQYEFLSCTYFLQNSSFYGCLLETFDPNGFNNFTDIEGIHLAGKTDDDVKYVTRGRIFEAVIFSSLVFKKFKNVEKFEITQTKIEKFEENVFQECKKLQHLDISYNKISKIMDDTFSGLNSLVRLYLSGNLIENFPQNIFKPLINLVSLEIDHLKLKILHSNSFGVHRSLTKLNLQYNKIDAFDEKIIDFTAISTLNMYGNLCVSRDISDYSMTRNSMRSYLQKCFQNFKNLTAGNNYNLFNFVLIVI